MNRWVPETSTQSRKELAMSQFFESRIWTLPLTQLLKPNSFSTPNGHIKRYRLVKKIIIKKLIHGHSMFCWDKYEGTVIYIGWTVLLRWEIPRLENGTQGYLRGKNLQLFQNSLLTMEKKTQKAENYTKIKILKISAKGLAAIKATRHKTTRYS